MKVAEIKDFIISLLDREIQEEYKYQMNGEKDPTYLKQCIIAKQWMLKKGQKGIEQLINDMIIKDDIENYVKNLESEK